MTLSREVVVPGMLAEYKSFSELVGGLSGEDWETPSRCEGWRVADVAAHVVGQLTDVVNLRLEGLGTPEVTQRQVDERRGKTPSELAAELESNVKVAGDLISAFDDGAWEAPGPTGVQGTLGSGIEALWFDTFLHADDMRSAIGRTTARGDGLRPSLSHIAQALLGPGLGACRSPLGRLRGVPCVRWRREDCHGRRFRLHPCLHGTWRPCGVRP